MLQDESPQTEKSLKLMTEKSLKLQDREVVNTTTEVRRYKTMGSPGFGMTDTRLYLAH